MQNYKMTTESNLPIPSEEVIKSITSYRFLRLSESNISQRVSFVVYSHSKSCIISGWAQQEKKTQRLSLEEGERLVQLSKKLTESSLLFDEKLKFVNVQFAERKIITLIDLDKDLVIVCDVME